MMYWICEPCGVKFGTRIPMAATHHYGVCDWCHQEDVVTEPRDYGIKTYNEDYVWESMERFREQWG